LVDLTTTESYKTFGSSTELWGTTWSVAEINSANFGVLLNPQSAQTYIRYVDHLTYSHG